MISVSERPRALIEGALLAAITVMLVLFTLCFPLFKVGIDLIVAVPLIIVTVRHGLLTGLLSTGFAGLLLFLLLGTLNILLLVLYFGVLALFYGWAFRRALLPGRTLLLGAVIVIVLLSSSNVLSYIAMDPETLDYEQRIQQNIDSTLELYREQGLFSSYNDFKGNNFTEEKAREILENISRIILLLIPGILIIWALTIAFFNYLVAYGILRKLKISVPRLPAFKEWRLPWWVIWGFIVGFTAYLAGDYLAQQTLLMVGMNIMVVYAPVTFVLGAAVMAFYLGKYLARSGFRWIAIFIFILFMRTVCIALAITGLVDMLFNYRRLPTKS